MSTDGPVLVAGAAGFVGRRVLASLRGAGVEAQALVRAGGSELPADARPDAVRAVDLRDEASTVDAVRDLAPSAIVNLARTGHGGDPESQAADHLSTLAHLLRGAAAAGSARFIQLGSPLEYGTPPSPVAEDAPLRPTTPYGTVKAAASALALASDDPQGMRTVVLRPFCVYGPGDRSDRLIPTAVRAALGGDELRLTPPGIGRDWVHVDDVARGCILALGGGADGEAVNLGSGEIAANDEVVAHVSEALGLPIRTAHTTLMPRPWDSAGLAASVAKAEALLGWRPGVSLAEGIRATVIGDKGGGREQHAPAAMR
jgi:nucleoside-diphosphate-sugar epimerase